MKCIYPHENVYIRLDLQKTLDITEIYLKELLIHTKEL